MTERNPIAVLLLPFVTFGIYGLIWYVQTGREMRALGADIPTAWLMLIPFVGLFQMWKYAVGVETVTRGQFSPIAAFLLLYLGPIGYAIIQSQFNNLPAATQQPTAVR